MGIILNHNCITKSACRRLTFPMFDKLKDPPAISAGDILLFSPASWSLLSSAVMSRIERFCTCFMHGSSNPCGVSVAMQMLWSAFDKNTRFLLLKTTVELLFVVL